MPLSKDKKGGGTNSDGTRSTTYCSLCFEGGAFTQPDFSVQEMQSFCIEEMKKSGFPRFLGWVFTRNLPKLERWRT